MKIPALIDNHKSIFGTYATMALNNIQIVLNHIQSIANLPGQSHKDEDCWSHPVMLFLNSSVDTNQSPEIFDKVKDRLLHSFPFLKIIADSQREHLNSKTGTNRLEINGRDIYWALNKMFRVLKSYRDYTMHYITVDSKFYDNSEFLVNHESTLSFTINQYYTAALREVKEKYNYNTADLAFIQDYRINRRTKKTDFNFFLSLQSFNGDAYRKAHLSGVGVALLICLFLEKKYINLFISKLPIFGKYPETSSERRIIHRSFTIKSIVLPKERIQSQHKAFSIALDLLGELKRCPRELFDTLSHDDQDQFRRLSKDYDEVLLWRSADRFVQHSLLYIDYNKLFAGIRFHVNMGKLRYLFAATKKCIDGQERVRVLEHELNGFGRIAEMEQYRLSNTDTYGDTNIPIRDHKTAQRDDSDEANYPYVVDTYANYILGNNKIEMCFCANCLLPEIQNTDNRWHVYKQPPHCRMSTLELPAMMFHMHLLGPKRTEARIWEVFSRYKSLFTELSKGELTAEKIEASGIPVKDLPQQVLDAISGNEKKPQWRPYVTKMVNEMRRETEQRIKRFKELKFSIRSGNNKIGSRSYKSISPGKLAEYLARDIIKFQPSNATDIEYGTDRMTGLNYRVMQAAIALFNCEGNQERYMQFYQLFRAAKLIGNVTQAHPFLDRVFMKRPQNTIEFYENYLVERKRYLDIVANSLQDKKNPQLPFFNKNKNKWIVRDQEYYTNLGAIYLEDVPIELPRQMFDEEIKDALKAIPQMNGVDFEHANVTYLISEYMKRVHNDDCQEFYNWKRNYRYMDLLNLKVDGKNSIKKQYLTTAERESLWANRMEHKHKYAEWAKTKKLSDAKLRRMSDSEFEQLITNRLDASRRDFQKSEKHIRRYKVQDALMFLMVKNTLTSHLDFGAKDFKLYDIMPNAEKGILSETMPLDFTYKLNGNTYTIKSKGLKLKNYGDFFALAYDKRMPSLLKILNTHTIDKEDIDREFCNYDSSRPAIVSLALDFEKFAFARHPELKAKAQAESFGFLTLLDDLLNLGDLTEHEKEVLRLIRNAFSHNSYPDHGILEIKTLPKVAKSLIDIFGNYVNNIQTLPN